MSTNPADALGDEDITNDTELLERCNRIRALARAAAIQTSYIADEVRALLSELADHPAAERPSRTRAKLVAGHIQNSADAFNAAAVNAVRAAASFRKHFAPELEAAYNKPARRKEPKFKIGDE